MMACLEQRGDQFHWGIRLGSRKLQRSLNTSDPKAAQERTDRVDRCLKLVEQGDLAIPSDADPGLDLGSSDGSLESDVCLRQRRSRSLPQLRQRDHDHPRLRRRQQTHHHQRAGSRIPHISR